MIIAPLPYQIFIMKPQATPSGSNSKAFTGLKRAVFGQVSRK